MVDVTTVLIMIASGGVFAAAVYYIIQIRHQTKVSQTELVMRLSSHFGSKEFQEALGKAIAVEFTGYMVEVGIFFEEIGILLHRNLIDRGLVDDLFRYSIRMTWEKMKPLIEGIRKQYNLPYAFGYFEYLYNEMRRTERKPPILQ